MSWDDSIGFIISILALIFLFFKNRPSGSKKQEQRPEQVYYREEPEDENLDDYLRSLELKRRESKPPAPPKPAPATVRAPAPKKVQSKKPLQSPLENYRVVSDIETRKIKSSIEDRRIKTELTQRAEERGHAGGEVILRPPRALKAIQRLSRFSDLVIYQEILSKPKSLRSE